MTCHGLALIDKQLNFYLGFDAILGTEATKMNGVVTALKELSL